MPISPLPCLFQVNVKSDGVGDLYHFIDFISAQGPEELINSYFVIHTNRSGEEHQQIEEIIRSLPQNHPLKQNINKIIYVSNDNAQKKADEIRGKINGPFCTYEISVSDFQDFSRLIKPEGATIRAYLSEHGFRTSEYGLPIEDIPDSSQFISFHNYMSVGPKSVGIFIHDSEAKKISDTTVLEKFRVDVDSVLTICYSHINTERNIQQLCLLHLQSNQGKSNLQKLVLFFPRGIPQALTEETRALLEKANCKLVDNGGKWLSTQEFEQLKIKQAQSATFGLASGDKSTEDCFSEGFWPVIEFKIPQKNNFWEGLTDTLSEFAAGLGEDQKNYCRRIIKYINESQEFCTFPEDQYGWKRLCDSIAQLDSNCFAFWKTIVCQYIKQNHDIHKHLQRNVKLFRMIAELLENPNSDYAKQARSFFESMDQEDYNNLILAYASGIKRYPVRLGYFYSPTYNRLQVTADALSLNVLLKIRKSILVGSEIEQKIAQIVGLRHISQDQEKEMYELIQNPDINKFMQFDHKDISVLKIVFYQAWDNFYKAQEEELCQKYMGFFEKLKNIDPNQKLIVADLVAQILPAAIDLSVKEKAHEIYAQSQKDVGQMPGISKRPGF